MSTSFRVAAIGDLHIRSVVPPDVVRHLHRIEERADILIITGDITNGGRILEAELAAELLQRIEIPILAVLGNHDRRTTRRRAFIRTLSQAGVRFLDGTTHVVTAPQGYRIGFAGVGGSGGGFWPEEAPDTISQRAWQAMSVRARREADRLDQALTQLEADCRVVVTHFAPTVSTLIGEPPVKYPLLGNSTLGRVIDQHQVDLVVHGHAHLGSPLGTTPGGVPVRNVSVDVGEGVTIVEIEPRQASTGSASRASVAMTDPRT
jgi:Icc-related predicted phosphoesterase